MRRIQMQHTVNTAHVKTARVFTGPNASGNACVVHLHSVAPVNAVPFPDKHTHCFSWLCNQQLTVQCFSASGQAIACCGHGLMAVAASQPEISVLTMNGSSVSCRQVDGDVELRFVRITSTIVDAPFWLHTFFPDPPCCCAVAGDEQGYLICQWPDGSDLRSLPVPCASLAEKTRRAIIVTTLVSPPDGQNDTALIHFRYFAPQYGTLEDDATGSALRVLADFWCQKQSIQTLDAYQCSPSGGVLHSRIEGSYVFIRGTVKWL